MSWRMYPWLSFGPAADDPQIRHPMDFPVTPGHTKKMSPCRASPIEQLYSTRRNLRHDSDPCGGLPPEIICPTSFRRRWRPTGPPTALGPTSPDPATMSACVPISKSQAISWPRCGGPPPPERPLRKIRRLRRLRALWPKRRMASPKVVVVVCREPTACFTPLECCHICIPSRKARHGARQCSATCMIGGRYLRCACQPSMTWLP